MRPGWPLAAVVSGMVASAMMQTLLANATPRIVVELRGEQWYGLVAGGYLIASTVTLPVFSQYSDRLGPRRVFVFGHLCFTTGSAALALAPDMAGLLAARILQGLGAGAIVPAGLAGLAMLLDERARARALAGVGVVQVLANGVGPPLGGWFTDGPGWRWGVTVALPFTIGALLLAGSLPTADVAAGWWRFDPGAQGRVWRRTGLLRFALLAALVGVTSLGVMNYAPLLLQRLHGMDATTTGWLLAPMLVGVGLGTALSSRCAQQGWSRPGGWLLMAVGAVVTLAPSTGLVLLGLVVGGIGAGVGILLLLLDAQARVPQEHLAQAGGIVQLGRNAGAAAGVPLLSLWLLGGLPQGAALMGIFLTIAGVAMGGLLLSGKEPR